MDRRQIIVFLVALACGGCGAGADDLFPAALACDACGADAGDAGDAEPDDQDEPDIDSGDSGDGDGGTGDRNSRDRDGGDGSDGDGGNADPDGDADTDPGDARLDANGDTNDADTDTDVDGDAGNDDPEPDPMDTIEDLWFVIGTGVYMYEELEDGDEVLLTQGIQGGFHVWGGARGTGFEPLDAAIEYRMTGADSRLVGAVYATQDFVEVGGLLEVSGITVFLDLSIIPEEIDGEAYRLCGTLFAGDGSELSDCVDIVARCCDYL